MKCELFRRVTNEIFKIASSLKKIMLSLARMFEFEAKGIYTVYCMQLPQCSKVLYRVPFC